MMDDNSGEFFRRDEVILRPDRSFGISAESHQNDAEAQPRFPEPLHREVFVPFGEPIGSGGQGVVHRAVQTTLRRIVALKRPAQRLHGPTISPTEESAKSIGFHREALTTALLDHPNIVHIHEIGQDGHGNPYLAMKLIRGRSWSALLTEMRDLPEAELLARAIPVLLSVSQAVAFAHSRGIIHRDLNPSQIMVGEFGEVYVTDWGLAAAWRPEILEESRLEIARALEIDPMLIGEHGPPSVRSASAPAGTAAWMAPEQSLPTPEKLGTWTDVFLLGGMLYYLLTFTVPNSRVNSGDRTFGPVERPSIRAPKRFIPAELDELCARAMTFEPEQRLADVREFVRSIEDYLAGSNRREEAGRIVGAATEAMSDGKLARLSYEQLGALERDLSRAVEMDASRNDAYSNRESVLARQAEIALEHGDLVLARTSIARLPEEGTQRANLLTRLDFQVAARARHARQRKLAMIAAATFLIVAGGMWAVAMRARSSELSQAKAREAAQNTAQLLREINDQRVAESTLAGEFAITFPAPDLSEGDSTSTLQSSTDSEALFARRRELARSRASLLSRSPEVAALLGEEPIALLLGEANHDLRLATNVEEMLDAYRRYGMISIAGEPPLEAVMGQGVAASLAGFGTSATLHLTRAADITRERLGPSHPDYAEALNRLAAAYRRNKDIPESYEKYYTRSLAIQEDNWLAATTALAESWGTLEDQDRPIEYASVALTTAERRYGPDSIEAARAGRLLGNSARLGEERALAIEKLERASHRMEEMLGADAVETLETRMDLAKAYSASHRTEDSIATAREVADGLEAVAGPDNPQTWKARAELAQILMTDTRFYEGAEILTDLVDRQTAALGPSHPETLSSRSMLATALANQGGSEERMAKARVVSDEVIEALSERMGPDHPATIEALTHRARISEILLDFDGAIATYEEQRARYIRRFPSSTSLPAMCDGRIATVYFYEDRPWEALPYVRRACVEGGFAEQMRCLKARRRFFEEIKDDKAELYFRARIIQLLRDIGADNQVEMQVELLWFRRNVSHSLTLAEDLTVARRCLVLQQMNPPDNSFDHQHMLVSYLLALRAAYPHSNNVSAKESAIVLRQMEEVIRGDQTRYDASTVETRIVVLLGEICKVLQQERELHPEREVDLRKAADWVVVAYRQTDPWYAKTRTEADARSLDSSEYDLAEEFGLQERLADGLQPEDYYSSNEAKAQSAHQILDHADSIVPRIDWEATFPEVADWSMAALGGPGMDNDAEFDALLARILSWEEPVLPDGPPATVATSGKEH